MARATAFKFALTSFALVAALAGAEAVSARSTDPWDANRATIQIAELPPQGLHTLRLIRQGGPFPFSKDGTVFGNRERLLPPQKRGYYREYTVPTPGIAGRGPRRIVCGAPAVVVNNCYYTADHYASFRRIAE